MREKIKGSVIGFAIGDAMGMPLEFRNDDKQVSGYEGNQRKCLKAGQYTDDTQHLEIGMDSAIYSKGAIDIDDIAKRLVTWYKTDARSMGRTTGEAIQNLIQGADPTKSGIDHINACGSLAIARLLPYSLLSALRPHKEKITDADTKRILGITHAHKNVQPMGALLNYFVQEVAHGRTTKGTNDMIIFENSFLNQRLRKRLRKVRDLAESSTSSYDAIQEIGNGGHVEDVMLSAIYSAIKYGDFREAVLSSANARGDSDSRAAITGALSGLELGVLQIPDEWREGLERWKELDEKARELYCLAK